LIEVKTYVVTFILNYNPHVDTIHTHTHTIMFYGIWLNWLDMFQLTHFLCVIYLRKMYF